MKNTPPHKKITVQNSCCSILSNRSYLILLKASASLHTHTHSLLQTHTIHPHKQTHTHTHTNTLYIIALICVSKCNLPYLLNVKNIKCQIVGLANCIKIREGTIGSKV